MDELRYPIGMQAFTKIIEEGYVYVDKTQYIPLLLRQGQYVFLSRPRRFGKSLFVSTLKAFFEGKREYFKGLAIDKEDVDWTPSPVLHFDFNSGLYSKPDGLRIRLDTTLSLYENAYGINPINRSEEALAARVEILIRTAFAATGRRVVILIDEYDKPLLGLEDYPDVFEHNQSVLKSVFGNLKSMDEYIRFGFLTGVARFSKVSIFSDLNNLQDISLDDTYAEICGITEAELEAAFGEGIARLAASRNEDYHTTLDILRDYYDGFLFTPKGQRLYNPYSVMQALKTHAIDPYWFGSATPTFLVKAIKSDRINPMDINGQRCTKRDLMEVRIGSKNPIPLMFQTGYLTIDSYDSIRQYYTLRFPNREVEKAFAEDLLPLYAKATKDDASEFSLFNFQDDLYDGDPEAFMKRLATLFKDMPGEDHREGTYRAITYLLCKLCSVDTRAEQRSYKGRSDLEVFTPDYIYIFEFKYDKSVSEAMRQIQDRDYAGRYAMDSREVFVIGANYSSDSARRGLQYEIKKLH